MAKLLGKAPGWIPVTEHSLSPGMRVREALEILSLGYMAPLEP